MPPPRTFGPDFLAWLRDATEQAWAAVEQPTLETFKQRGAGGTAWQRGTRWGTGLSDLEIDAAEQTWSLVFPPDHRLFLRTLHAPDRPMFSAHFSAGNQLTAGTAPSFFDWRTDHIALTQALAWPLEGLAFDVEQNDLWLPRWADRPNTSAARLLRLRELISHAPRLIPICGHRFLLGDPAIAGNPVLSLYQSDLIVYGCDLRQFLLNELAPLIGLTPDHSDPVDVGSIPFWGAFLDPI